MAKDGKIKSMGEITFNNSDSNSAKRQAIANRLRRLLRKLERSNQLDKCEVICIVERIRLKNYHHINLKYITSIGALIGTIVDVMSEYSIETYSVDTRAWKSDINCLKKCSNNYGVPPEKWLTIKYFIDRGFEAKLKQEITTRKSKGTFLANGKKWKYNDNIADSAAIALFGFSNKPHLLQPER